jgi:hypothetical protein
MDLPADSVELIRQWAARTNAVREVWLFGSRAKGTSRPDSDVDIGIYLMPREWRLARASLHQGDYPPWQLQGQAHLHCSRIIVSRSEHCF